MCDNKQDYMEAVVLLSHGSRREEANRQWINMWELFRNKYPHRLIEGGFIEFADPLFEKSVRTLCEMGVKKIYIVPIFLMMGNHIRQTIPERLEIIRNDYPAIQIEVTNPIGADPILMDIIENRLQENGFQQ